MTEISTPPSSDTVEVTLIGPGYGESVVVHLGDNKWIAVDSCIDPRTRRSAPLEYLQALGVDVESSVLAIVVTHYDDDHIGGVAEFIDAAKSARIITPSAYITKDFLTFVSRINQSATTASTLVSDERLSNIAKLFDLALSGRSMIPAGQNTILYAPGSVQLTHGLPFSLVSLSPCHEEIRRFHQWVAMEMPLSGQTKRALPKRLRNDVSVALDLRIGAMHLLLGADLEEEGDPTTGWTAIIGDPGRLAGRAQIYKVAHHGSKTGHHDQIWTDLLESKPLSVIAPWINGKGVLPKADDRDRIGAQSPTSFVTSAARTVRVRRGEAMVEKQIRLTTGTIRAARPASGMVRLRKPATSKSDVWSVELFDTAMHLADWDPPKV